MSQVWTEDERERIKQFAESGNPDDLLDGDESVRSNSGPADDIGVSVCEEWRNRIHDDNEHAAEIARDVPNCASTVRNHVYGYCDHPEHAVGEPAESPGPGGVGW